MSTCNNNKRSSRWIYLTFLFLILYFSLFVSRFISLISSVSHTFKVIIYTFYCFDPLFKDNMQKFFIYQIRKMTSFVEQRGEFEINVKTVLRMMGVELRQPRWDFHWVFVELLCVWRYAATRCKSKNWKRFVAAAL